MVFALLIAAILWNLGTWYFGLLASSTHTMVGSIIGVGIANQLMNHKQGTSGVDWGQALNIAALFLLLAKAVIKDKRLYEAPVGTVPTAYALDHAVTPAQTADYLASSQQTMQVVGKYVKPFHEMNADQGGSTQILQAAALWNFRSLNLLRSVVEAR